MAITYPVSPDSRWAVYQVSTGEIVGRDKSWPRADGGEIVGLDPDYVYLLQVRDAEPDYDSRLYQLIGSEAVDVNANTVHLSWTVQERPIAEKVMAAQNREAEQLERVIGQLAREAIETRLIVGAILNYALKNQTYPTKVQTMVNDYVAKALKVWSNRDTLQAKITAIQASQPVDLDSGWVQ